MGQIAEVICGPLIKMLEERIINNEIKRKKLQNKKKEISMVFEQIQSENARSSASRSVSSATVDNSEKNKSPVTTKLETLLDTNTVMDSVALDDILLGNISKSSVGDLCRRKTDPTSFEASSSHCTTDEFCVSSSVETPSTCCQPDVPSTSKNTCTLMKSSNEIQISHVYSLQLDSPPDSPKENSF